MVSTFFLRTTVLFTVSPLHNAEQSVQATQMNKDLGSLDGMGSCSNFMTTWSHT